MKELLTSNENSSAEKIKNIYTYVDDSNENEEIVFEITAKDIQEANEKYKKETGNDPVEQPNIICRIESLLDREKKEFNKFLVDVIEKRGITLAEFGEQEEKQTYENYLERLNISEDLLKNKKILDFGSDKCFFASYCAKKNINNEVYSVEGGNESYADKEIKKVMWSDQIRNAVEGKTVKALAQKLPFKSESFELILCNSAMPGRDKEYFGNLTMEEDVNSTYNEIVRILKSSGEARLQPFDANEDDEYFGKWAKATKKKLAELSEKENIQVVMERMEDGENLFRVIIKKIIK